MYKTEKKENEEKSRITPFLYPKYILVTTHFFNKMDREITFDKTIHNSFLCDIQ